MLTLKNLLNVESKMNVTDSTTVYDIKKQLSKKTRISPERINLFHLGKELSDDRLISSYKIPKNSHVLYIIRQRNIQKDLTSYLDSEIPDCMRNMIRFRGDSMSLVYIFSKIVYSDKIRFPQKRRPTDPLNFEYLIQKLKILGYSEQRIANALRRADYNVELAAAVLFEDLDFAQQIEEIIDISNLIETFSTIGDDDIDSFQDSSRKLNSNENNELMNEVFFDENYILNMPTKINIDLNDVAGLYSGSDEVVHESSREEPTVASPTWDIHEGVSTTLTPVNSKKINPRTPQSTTVQVHKNQRRATTFLPALHSTQPPKEKQRGSSIQSSRYKTASSVPVVTTQQNQQRMRRLNIRRPSLTSQRTNL